MKARPHPRQAERLAALRSYDILDTPRESDFDDIVALASRICETPISVVNLIDAERQWFKAETGLGVRETPLATSLCSHAILEDSFVEIPDTLNDPRMADNALCAGQPGLRFYAGALLKTRHGLPLGTLCVLDYQPRVLSDLQRQTLVVLARQVMSQLDLRLALKRQKVLVKEIDHRVKNLLTAVSAAVRLERQRAFEPETRDILDAVAGRIARIAALHEQLYRDDSMADVDLAAYLARLVETLRPSLPEDVSLELAAESIRADATAASAVGVIVSEFAMNSARHAFPPGRAGRIEVTLGREDRSNMLLQCRDNGVGVKTSLGESRGIGLRLIEASAAQLGGTMRVVTDKGFAIEARLPI